MRGRVPEAGANMDRERLEAIGAALAAHARNAGDALWTGVTFIGAKLTAMFMTVLQTTKWVLRWLFLPKAETPLDVLKHIVSVFSIFMGVMALAWAGKQVIFPPLVVTVMDLPGPLKTESWVNPELSRTLINEIERMRNVVKGQRDPAFEAVLNPPNITIKTGDGWSLNVQEQILTPLGSLLGFGQGEVHLALSCYQPNCLRTKDPDCRELIPDPKTGPERQHLCLRLTADIQRGRVQRRLTARMILNNDTYHLEITKQMTRIAEAVTSVADPATAALYFYRRVREEGAATRSITNDPEVIAELRGEAYRAAEQAETNGAVSECWAHSVRAHLAIHRREFKLADVYLDRARSIPRYRHLMKGKFPVDCDRLVAIAEMEFARRLARPLVAAGSALFEDDTDTPIPVKEHAEDEDIDAAEADASKRKRPTSYPAYEDDVDDKRVTAAYARVKQTAERYGGSAATASFFGKSFDDDLVDALELARSEIGLGWFTQTDQCRLLAGEAVPIELIPDLATGRPVEPQAPNAPVDAKFNRIRTDTWHEIQRSLKRITESSPEPYLPLRRQAAIDLMERLAANAECINKIQDIAKQLFLNHPNDPKVAQLFGLVTEQAAMGKTRSLTKPAAPEDRGNEMLGFSRSIYSRMVDIGDDKSDVFALSRLAFVTEAFLAEKGTDGPRRSGPNPDTLQTMTRAWKRYQQQLYPTASRHHAEQIVSFWGALLLYSYPKLVDLDLTTEASRPSDVGIDEMRSAIAQYAEFHRAWEILFPGAPVKKLADLPQVEGIGTRVGCLCMLSHMTYEHELADFLIVNINKWQRPNVTLDACRIDMIPPINVTRSVLRSTVTAHQRLAKAEADYEAASETERVGLKRGVDRAKLNADRADARWIKAAIPARLTADAKLAAEQLAAIKAAVDTATGGASVELQSRLVMATAADAKAKEELERTQSDAKLVSESIRPKVATLRKAEADCRAQPASVAP